MTVRLGGKEIVDRVKIGDMVMTDFIPYEADHPRRVTNVFESQNYGSGRALVLDGKLGPLDAAWVREIVAEAVG